VSVSEKFSYAKFSLSNLCLHGLICAVSTVYPAPVVILEPVRHTSSSFCHIDRMLCDVFKSHNIVKILCTRCISQDQNAPELVFALLAEITMRLQSPDTLRKFLWLICQILQPC